MVHAGFQVLLYGERKDLRLVLYLKSPGRSIRKNWKTFKKFIFSLFSHSGSYGGQKCDMNFMDVDPKPPQISFKKVTLPSASVIAAQQPKPSPAKETFDPASIQSSDQESKQDASALKKVERMRQRVQKAVKNVATAGSKAERDVAQAELEVVRQAEIKQAEVASRKDARQEERQAEKDLRAVQASQTEAEQTLALALTRKEKAAAQSRLKLVNQKEAKAASVVGVAINKREQVQEDSEREATQEPRLVEVLHDR